MTDRMRLKDLCSAVPGDVATGIIIGKTKETNKIFRDISELTAQFQLDTVLSFDIIAYKAEMALVVKLAHWGN